MVVVDGNFYRHPFNAFYFYKDCTRYKQSGLNFGMLKEVPKYLRLSVLIFALLALILIILLPLAERVGFSAGYFLGLFAVIIHLISVSYTHLTLPTIYSV